MSLSCLDKCKELEVSCPCTECRLHINSEKHFNCIDQYVTEISEPSCIDVAEKLGMSHPAVLSCEESALKKLKSNIHFTKGKKKTGKDTLILNRSPTSKIVGKECGKCKVVKDIEFFSSAKGSKGIINAYQNWCKQCFKEYRAEYKKRTTAKNVTAANKIPCIPRKYRGVKRGKHSKASKIVEQYDLEGNLIDTFISVAVASKYIGINPGTLYTACKRNGKNGGFIWRFRND